MTMNMMEYNVCVQRICACPVLFATDNNVHCRFSHPHFWPIDNLLRKFKNNFDVSDREITSLQIIMTNF